MLSYGRLEHEGHANFHAPPATKTDSDSSRTVHRNVKHILQKIGLETRIASTLATSQLLRPRA